MMNSVANLSIETQRKIASIVGAVVGDAACLHLEWVYDQNKVAKIVGDNDPAFWKENHNPFFSLPNGNVTCYADEAVQVLSCMSDNDGVFDQAKVINHFLKHFGDPSSPYQIALAKRKDKKYPIEGPWIQGAMMSMMDRNKAGIYPPGPDDAVEHDGLVTSLPLIIQQTPNLVDAELEKAFHIMTTDPLAVEHHKAEAFLINQFIQDVDDPIKATKEKFETSKDIFNEIVAVEEGLNAGKTAKELVKKFGMACPMPGSFQSSLVSIIGAKSYPEAIRETVMCGGDACSRSNLVGACLGAKFGLQGIPEAWINGVDGIDNIIKNAIKCFS